MLVGKLSSQIHFARTSDAFISELNKKVKQASSHLSIYVFQKPFFIIVL